jgi:hypothetical protein
MHIPFAWQWIETQHFSDRIPEISVRCGVSFVHSSLLLSVVPVCWRLLISVASMADHVGEDRLALTFVVSVAVSDNTSDSSGFGNGFLSHDFSDCIHEIRQIVAHRSSFD